MKVLVITGSPHVTGTTAHMADRFIEGAEAAGHEVFRFDAAQKNVHPCIACEKCHRTETGCVFKDSMEELNPHLLEAEVIAFVSPIYYYDINAQVKAVIDRFYANDAEIHGEKKAVLITAMADDVLESADGANVSFARMTGFLKWEIAGILNAVACPDVNTLKMTRYPEMAYELGRNL